MNEQLGLDFAGVPDQQRRKVNHVLFLIYRRQGDSKPISLDELENVTGIKRRTVQAIVKYLRDEKHHPIGSKMKPPYGYYWIVNESERRETRNSLLRRALHTLEGAKALDSDDIVAPLIGQFPLEIIQEDES